MSKIQRKRGEYLFSDTERGIIMSPVRYLEMNIKAVQNASYQWKNRSDAIQHIAELMKVTRQTFYRWLKDEILPPIDKLNDLADQNLL